MRNPILIGCGVVALLMAGCNTQMVNRTPSKERSPNESNTANLSEPTLGSNANAAAGLQPPPPSGSPKYTYPRIVKQPVSFIAEAGTYVELAVLIDNNKMPVNYQWRLNDGKSSSVFAPIPGATNSSFWITHVQFSDVGSYHVVVTGNGTNVISEMVHLSVYDQIHTNSTLGTLQTPVLAFTGTAFTCGGIAFTHSFTPTNDFGKTGLLYGRYASPQYSPFQNLSYGTHLSVYTLNAENSPSTTGVRLRQNFDPFGDCCSSSGVDGPRCGPITTGDGAGDPNHANTYRFTIFYNDPRPTSGKVTYHWLYEP